MLTPELYKHYFSLGISYADYIKNFENELNAEPNIPYHEYLPMNWQRTNRVYKTTTVLPEIFNALKKLKEPLNWLLISENWCGDASQIVPVIAKIANENEEKINLKIVYRDKNLELMDAHLTGTSRSIPMLIQLNRQFNVTGTWGPRPKLAQELVKRLKSNEETSQNYQEEIHKWYASDKQTSVQTELLVLLNQSMLITA
ncbi:MAG: thioredoxin family protein [Bacteroidia bacterium]